MTNIIETQGMIQRTADFAKDSSHQLHRTDVSQDAFTKEMKARAQRELQQTVGVTGPDGDVRIKESRERGARQQAADPKKKQRRKAKTPSDAARRRYESDSKFDIRI